MNIRQAILKAADSIEQYPKLFDYNSCKCPNYGCGTPGCALGWIGFHLGRAVKVNGARQGKFENGLDDIASFTTDDGDAVTFYNRMHGISRFSWQKNAAKCAKALRLYADKYHPEKHKRFHAQLIPAEPDYQWNPTKEAVKVTV